MLFRLGSMASRSPMLRPGMLPPDLNGRLVRRQVRRGRETAGRRRSGIPRVRVRAGEHVEPIGIDGVGREAVDAGEAPVVPADPVEQRDPAAGARVPAVGAADVGAGVDEVGLGRIEDDAGHVAAADDLDVAPGVGIAVRPRRRRKVDGHRQGEQCDGRQRLCGLGFHDQNLFSMRALRRSSLDLRSGRLAILARAAGAS